MDFLEQIVITLVVVTSVGALSYIFYYGRKIWGWIKKNLDIYRGV